MTETGLCELPSLVSIVMQLPVQQPSKYREPKYMAHLAQKQNLKVSAQIIGSSEKRITEFVTKDSPNII